MKPTKKPRAPRATRPVMPAVPPGVSESSNSNTQPSSTTKNPDHTLDPPNQTSPKTTKLRVKWTESDDIAMIDVLLADRQPANAAIGPENATSAQGWKRPTWGKIVEKLAGSEIKMINGVRQISGVKSIENCKSRWYVVSRSSDIIFFLLSESCAHDSLSDSSFASFFFFIPYIQLGFDPFFLI